MGEKCVGRLESSTVNKRRKQNEIKATGSCDFVLKREHEASDTDNDDPSPKRIKTFEFDEKLRTILASPLATLRIALQTSVLGEGLCHTASRIPRRPQLAALAMSFFQVRLKIFKNLPVSSLLQFALVSKNWYDETRSVLEKFKTCAALIQGHQPCVDLFHLNNQIPWMARIPFNSLKLKVFRDHQPCVSSDEIFDVETLLGNILAMPLKSLDFNRNQWMDSDCLASCLLREAFQGRYQAIEKMIFPLLPPIGYFPRKQDIFKEKSLPNLKYLECRMFKSSSQPLFLLAAQVAPNIQEILTPLEVSSSKNELQLLNSNQLALAKWLLLQPVMSVLPEVVRLTNFSCGLRRLEVMAPPVDDMRTDRSWMMAVNQLLECSRLTLEYLSLANHELMLSFDRTVKPFPSLKYFQISIASMTDQLPGILSRFRLGQLFPNLIGLRIFFNQLSTEQAADLDTTVNTFQGFENDGNSQLWPPITRLEFHVSPARSFSHWIFDHFARKCPQITDFAYEGLGEQFLNYQMFTYFPQLKRLKLIVTANHVANLDEFLCGLDTEDVIDLTGLPMEKLEQIHVFPRRHCINNLTDLEHFKLVVHEPEKLEDNQRSHRSVLSHVTGVLVFSRWPSLKAEINCHLDDMRYLHCEALYPLRPFAKVNEIIRILS